MQTKNFDYGAIKERAINRLSNFWSWTTSMLCATDTVWSQPKKYSLQTNINTSGIWSEIGFSVEKILTKLFSSYLIRNKRTHLSRCQRSMITVRSHRRERKGYRSVYWTVDYSSDNSLTVTWKLWRLGLSDPAWSSLSGLQLQYISAYYKPPFNAIFVKGQQLSDWMTYLCGSVCVDNLLSEGWRGRCVSA